MRKYSLHIAFVVIFMCLGANIMKSELRITELMQSNVVSLYDNELRDFPDSWVELYNDGNVSVNLENYSIGIKDKLSKAYSLPRMTLLPKKYVVIYCDKVGNGLHTDFRLESNKKGNVYLFKDNELLTSVSHPSFPAPDVSYGCNESGEWGYMLHPTPGSLNNSEIVEGTHILGNPLFSHEGCIYPDFASVSIYLPEDAPEGTLIRYTLDGSMPTEDSFVINSGETIDLDPHATIIRARLFKDGWLSPMPVSHSYINHLGDMTMPIISIITDDTYLYDKSKGILDPNNRSKDWRRPINFEYFNIDSKSSATINQVCEMRVGGNYSRVLHHPSLMVYANKRFGVQRLNCDFFPTQKPGLNEFKSIYLRNSGNDYYETYIRDAVAQMSMGLYADIDWQAVQPTVIYLNGEYNGILNLRERSNEDYVWSNYDGLEDIDMVENFKELKSGTMESFNDFVNFYHGTKHTSEEYHKVVDVKEVLDVLLLNLFFNNTDFPGNNMVLWRPSTDNGIWRIIVKDVDYAMGIKNAIRDTQLPPTFNTVEWFNTPYYNGGGNTWGNAPEYTLLFRRLLDFDDIREEFLDRCYIYMGDFLNEKKVKENISILNSQIDSEWESHAALHLQNNTFGDRNSNLAWMKQWISKRRLQFGKMLAEYYNLGELTTLNITIDENNLEETLIGGTSLFFNGESLKTKQFSGKWPASHNADLAIEGFEGEILWEIETDGNKRSVSGSTLNLNLSNTKNVKIKVYLGKENSINPIYISFPDSEPEYFNLSGTKLNNKTDLPRGIYLEKVGGKVKKIVVN